jgi:uncharacterized protein
MSSTGEFDDEHYSDQLLRKILRGVKTIAVVGASNKPERPSFEVAAFLGARGYRIVCVNPAIAGQTIHGAPCVENLAKVREPIDMVDIFRNSAAAGGVVAEALALQPLPAVIWMQLGVRDANAAKRARALGLTVVMNRCPKIEYARLLTKSHER